MSHLLHSNTSTLAVLAWRKHFWKRVRICSLCATPCLCTRRPQTSSSGSLSSRRTLRVRLQSESHTHGHKVASNNFTQISFQMFSKRSTAYSLLLWFMELNRIMGLKRMTCLQYRKCLIHWLSELWKKNCKLLFAFACFRYKVYKFKSLQMVCRSETCFWTPCWGIPNPLGVRHIRQYHFYKLLGWKMIFMCRWTCVSLFF